MFNIEKEIEDLKDLREVLCNLQIDITEVQTNYNAKRNDFLSLTNYLFNQLQTIRDYFKYKIEKLEEGQ